MFARGFKSNWIKDDDLQPASAITTTFFNNQETGHSARQLGFSTDFDAVLYTLAAAAAKVQLHLRVNQHQTPHVTILSMNPDLRPHPGQSFSRKFCTTLT